MRIACTMDSKPDEKLTMMTATSIVARKPTTPSVANDPRWSRIVARDKTADGRFWYSVSTTGVYCRPGCPSRIAKPGNVQIHDSLEELSLEEQADAIGRSPSYFHRMFKATTGLHAEGLCRCAPREEAA